MRLTSRSLLGLSSVAAIAISATVGGTALASRGADDVAPTSSTRITDDQGGLTNRDLRNEPGDDRRLNGIPTGPTSAPTASPSSTPSARPSATSCARPSASSTHRAGDDHGRRHGGRGADDKGRHTGTDDSGHHSGSDDNGRHGGRDDSGKRHGGHGSDD
jgi:hypothetical protein